MTTTEDQEEEVTTTTTTEAPLACTLCDPTLPDLAFLNPGATDFSVIDFTAPDGCVGQALTCMAIDPTQSVQIEVGFTVHGEQFQFNEGRNGVQNGPIGGDTSVSLICGGDGVTWFLDGIAINQIECDSTMNPVGR